MDIAGEAAAKFVRKLLLSANNQKIFHILIVAGKGNNGGDAFATAKYLLLQKSIFEKSGCDINISIICKKNREARKHLPLSYKSDFYPAFDFLFIVFQK